MKMFTTIAVSTALLGPTACSKTEPAPAPTEAAPAAAVVAPADNATAPATPAPVAAPADAGAVQPK